MFFFPGSQVTTKYYYSLIEKILHHLGCIKPGKQWDKQLTQLFCHRISSINRSSTGKQDAMKAASDKLLPQICGQAVAEKFGVFLVVVMGWICRYGRYPGIVYKVL